MNADILNITVTLPTLLGSPKQVEWGNALRKRFLSGCAFCFDLEWEGIQMCIGQGLDDMAKECQNKLDKKQEAMNRVLLIPWASFYIDSRNKSVDEILAPYMAE